MKETKFKVWDEDKEQMHQANEICRIHFDCDNGKPYCVLLWSGEMILHHFVLLEYVGLPDAHDEEVYREDLISFTVPEDIPKEARETRRVIWDEGMLAFQARTLDGKFACFLHSEQFEIIGNSLENPEMPKGGKK